ncbi:hypothetical protein FCM35_KLT13868 [Carex littledalei]|uniref:Uncharacterized protein n=1 Tax=Carex littledalei TaxID=544730 RepID=A0A833QHY9_9POAL|nr:hypothetical protein FCM35_KLT13868 [Carex littledalei]
MRKELYSTISWEQREIRQRMKGKDTETLNGMIERYVVPLWFNFVPMTFLSIPKAI